MSDAEPVEKPKKTKRKRRFGLWFLAGCAVLGLAGFVAVLALTGRVLPAPDWIVTRIEARANAALEGQARVTLGGAELVVDEKYVPRVWLKDMELFAADGTPLAILPELRVTLKAQPVLRGRLEPRRIRLSGARVSLTRSSDGGFGLSVGDADMPGLATGSLPEVVETIDRIFELPVLSGIERVEANDLDISLDDQRSNQTLRVSQGRLLMVQDARDLSVSLGFELAGIGAAPASAEVSFTSRKRSPAAQFGARVSNVSAKDLAAQSPALAWLGVLDAPISGAFRSSIGRDGSIGQLDGALEFGAGALNPTDGVKPVRFDQAKVYLGYDPATARLDFSEISVSSRALRVRADAKGWLQEFEAGLPNTLVGQVRITDLQADPEGLFETAAVFPRGALDFKLALEPFAVTVGQLVLVEGQKRIMAEGDIAANTEGWTVALDFKVNEITHDKLLALWPVGLVSRTRNWVATNVTTGELFDMQAALRLRPGKEPRVSLNYEYRGAEVRVLRTLPPIENGAGYSTIDNNTYTLVVDRGYVTAPSGGQVDVTGSVLQVPDIRLKPAPAIITLQTDSTITSALSLLNEPPFQFLDKADRPVDIAEGHARAEAVLRLKLERKVNVKDVDYDVSAQLTRVRSEQIVPGRVVTSAGLDLRATPDGIEISGPGTLSGVPFRVNWRQGFGPDQRGISRLAGNVELSPRFLTAFGIGLPEGTVAGRGPAQIEIDVPRDGAPLFRLVSDLNRLKVSIPQLGWSKPVGRNARLEVSGILGVRPDVETLYLSATGLELRGSVSTAANGSLGTARLSRVDTGWFQGSAELRGRGPGQPPEVAITGGTMDMRRVGAAGGGGGGAGGTTPISVALDRLQISEGNALTAFRGQFDTGGGMTGNFTGSLNGRAPITGAVVPGAGGRSAFRITSQDAGAVLRAADIFTKGRGGALDLTLRPVGPPGTYEGLAQISDIRVKDAPALTDLLSAISVVGLLEQISGEGILFTDVDGQFRLTPGGIELRRGAAIGSSLGVSMAGVYNSDQGRIDMRGVVSPFYLVNRVGQAVSRRGEGLFGINYRLVGPADAPRVRVNPLSILTPGIFRDIFRRPPPRVRQ